MGMVQDINSYAQVQWARTAHAQTVVMTTSLLFKDLHGMVELTAVTVDLSPSLFDLHGVVELIAVTVDLSP